MMSPSLFREHLKSGNVSTIEIFQQSDKTVKVYVQLRRHLFEYSLKRSFVTIQSACHYVLKAIDKPVFDGLTVEYQAIPPITIRKTMRLQNEARQHEQTEKQESFSQGSAGSSS